MSFIESHDNIGGLKRHMESISAFKVSRSLTQLNFPILSNRCHIAVGKMDRQLARIPQNQDASKVCHIVTDSKLSF